MSLYLLITDELKNIIADMFFGDWTDKIMPRLIGYATLDNVDINEYCLHNIKSYTCVTGHRVIAVFTNTGKNVDEIIDGIDKLLMHELMSPYMNNETGLSMDFMANANKVYANVD